LTKNDLATFWAIVSRWATFWAIVSRHTWLLCPHYLASLSLTTSPQCCTIGMTSFKHLPCTDPPFTSTSWSFFWMVLKVKKDFEKMLYVELSAG
jgi:hypothetical protein